MRTQTMNSAMKLISMACLGMATPLWAGGPGTTAGQFLTLGVGARALAMGGAYAAVADETHALYWNPAGAAQLDRPQLGSSFNSLYQDVNQGFIGYAHPTRLGVWGGGIDYLQVAHVERRLGDTTAPDYTFTARDSAVMLSYARPQVLSNLALGANLKVIQSHIDSRHANAYATDLGALYQAEGSPLSLGLAVLNFGTGLKYVSATDPLPLAIKAGAAYRLLGERLLLATGIDAWVRDRRTYGEFGLEYKPVSVVALRAGYQLGHGQDQLGNRWVGTSVGLGINLKSVTLDYAFVPYGDLGNTQRFSLGIAFGSSAKDAENGVIRRP